MADTFTSDLVLTKPEVGGSENDWGAKLNSNFDAIADDASKTYAGDPNGSVAGDYIGQRVYDTTNRITWVCRTAGNASTAVWTATGIAYQTKLIFPDTATAPAGWTILTTAGYNNAAIRINTAGTASTGGAVDFDTAFAAGRSADSHTLTTGEIPVHNHTGTVSISDPGHYHTYNEPSFTASAPGGGASLVRTSLPNVATSINTTGITATTTINDAGSGGGHVHGLPSFAVKYVHSIIAQRDS